MSSYDDDKEQKKEHDEDITETSTGEDEIIEMLNDYSKQRVIYQQQDQQQQQQQPSTTTTEEEEINDTISIDMTVSPATDDTVLPKTNLNRQVNHREGPGAFPITTSPRRNSNIHYNNNNNNSTDIEQPPQHNDNNNNNNGPVLEVVAELVTDNVRHIADTTNKSSPLSISIPEATNVVKVAEPIDDGNYHHQDKSDNSTNNKTWCNRNVAILIFLIIVLSTTVSFFLGVFLVNLKDSKNEDKQQQQQQQDKFDKQHGCNNNKGGDGDMNNNNCKEQRDELPSITFFDHITQHALFFRARTSTDCKEWSTPPLSVDTDNANNNNNYLNTSSTIILKVQCGNGNKQDGKEFIQLEDTSSGITCDRSSPYSFDCIVEMDVSAIDTAESFFNFEDGYMKRAGAIFFSCGHENDFGDDGTSLDTTTDTFQVASAQLMPVQGHGCSSSSSTTTSSSIAISMFRYCDSSDGSNIRGSILDEWKPVKVSDRNCLISNNSTTTDEEEEEDDDTISVDELFGCGIKAICTEETNNCTIDTVQAIDYRNDVSCGNQSTYTPLNQSIITKTLELLQFLL